MRTLRHPAAARGELRDRHLGARGHVLARDRPDGPGAQRGQRNVLSAQPAREAGVSGRHDAEHTRRGLVQLCGPAVDVVKHDQRRSPRPGAGSRRRARAHPLLHLMRELRDEPRAADPRRARDDDDDAGAGARPRPCRVQALKLRLAPDQRRTRLELRGQLARATQVQPRVLAQDRRVQPAQLAAGFDADLVDERGTRAAVGLQRLRLPTRAIQREHQLPVQALAQRVIGDEPFELCDELAMAPVGELGVDRTRERGQAQRLQATDLRRRERLVGDVGQRRATPERERLARRAVCHEPLEPSRVDLLGGDVQLVATPAREDLERGPVAAVSERTPKERDVLLDHLRRGRRRPLAP